jgi:hypothetical protein
MDEMTLHFEEVGPHTSEPILAERMYLVAEYQMRVGSNLEPMYLFIYWKKKTQAVSTIRDATWLQ